MLKRAIHRNEFDGFPNWGVALTTAARAHDNGLDEALQKNIDSCLKRAALFGAVAQIVWATLPFSAPACHTTSSKQHA